MSYVSSITRQRVGVLACPPIAGPTAHGETPARAVPRHGGAGGKGTGRHGRGAPALSAGPGAGRGALGRGQARDGMGTERFLLLSGPSQRGTLCRGGGEGLGAPRWPPPRPVRRSGPGFS